MLNITEKLNIYCGEKNIIFCIPSLKKIDNKTPPPAPPPQKTDSCFQTLHLCYNRAL